MPIQLAAMGRVGTSALAEAVARAGGLGMVPLDARPLARSAPLDRTARAAIGVGALMPFLDVAALEAAAAEVAVVELFYGDPDPAIVALGHAGGALVSWQVGSGDEARAAVDAGCDLVVAQGTEAGGHVRGTTRLLPLLDDVLSAVDVPVVAAGGIATGRAMAAALAAGADAVRVGTRFLVAPEADVHPDYCARILDAGDDDTVLTEVFSLGWPGAPHRVLASAAARAVASGAPVGPAPPTRETDGDIAAMALYAGHGVGHVREVMSAGAIVEELNAEATRLLARFRTGGVAASRFGAR